MNIRLFSVPLEKRKIFFQRRSMQKTAALGLVINCRFWGRPLPYHLLWDITDPIRQMIRSAAAGFFTMDMGRNEAAAKAAVKPSFGKNEKRGLGAPGLQSRGGCRNDTQNHADIPR